MCLLVPCHRVVGAGGKLTGYAGGLARKRFLLDLEAEVRSGLTVSSDGFFDGCLTFRPATTSTACDRQATLLRGGGAPRLDRAASMPGRGRPDRRRRRLVETFLSALRAYPSLPADANVEAWLVTIAHRKAIDIVRKAQRSAKPMAVVPAEASGRPRCKRDRSHSAAQPAAGAATLAVVYHYLGGLPTRRWPPSSAGAPRPHGEPPPTGSPSSERPER